MTTDGDGGGQHAATEHSLHGGPSVVDEVTNDRRHHRRIGLVGEAAVPLEQADPGMGDGGRRSLGRLGYDGHAVGTGDEECRHRERRELSRPVQPVLLGPALTGNRGCGGETRRPERAGPEGVDLSAVICRMSTNTVVIAAS